MVAVYCRVCSVATEVKLFFCRHCSTHICIDCKVEGECTQCEINKRVQIENEIMEKERIQWVKEKEKTDNQRRADERLRREQRKIDLEWKRDELKQSAAYLVMGLAFLIGIWLLGNFELSENFEIAIVGCFGILSPACFLMAAAHFFSSY